MSGPFDLADERAYQAWRDGKLSCLPSGLEVIELRDPKNLRPAEREALVESCARTNMALYRSPVTREDKDIPRLLGLQLGLENLERDISSITPDGDALGEFIPYTHRAIGWHTDGYYNPQSRRIRAMTLHCVRAASAP